MEPTPWWVGCSGSEYPHWLEVPQLIECQDDLSESRWTGSGTLHSVWVCRVKRRAKSSSFDWTEKTLAKDTAAFEDTTQDCLAIQAKAADFKNPAKSLSEELEVLAKAKDVISEKTDNSEYRDSWSVLSSHGGLAGELIKSEHSIELAQLTSHVASAMHAPKGEAEESEPPYRTTRSGDIVMVIDGETFCVSEEDLPKVYHEEDDGQVLPTEQVHEGMQRELQLMKDLEVSERILRTDVPSGKKIYSNGDDSSAKVKGLISDMIARLEEKASADATHKD